MRQLLGGLWCSARQWPLSVTIALSWSLMMLIELSPATSLGPPLLAAITIPLLMPAYLATVGSSILATAFNLTPPIALLLIALFFVACDRFVVPLVVWRRRT